MEVEYRNMHVTRGKKKILHGVNLTAESGKITGIIGPNGCGKSTLLKTTLGLYAREAGEILIDGNTLSELSNRQLAQLYGYVGQDSNCIFDFTVYEVVSMAVRGKLGKGVERNAVMDALNSLGIAHLRDRNIQSLSGGEKKMVFIARAFAQGVDIIILDEPTNHLDIKHQLFILDLLKKSKKTIIIVLHDLRLAAHYCDKLYLLENGKNVCCGEPTKVLSKENVLNVFGVEGFAYKKDEKTLDFNLNMK